MMATATNPDAPAMLTAALDYLGRGLSVFPVCTPQGVGRCVQHGECPNAGKRPLVRWEPYQGRRATEQELAQWWRKWPSANIGMATGAVSGVVVLDADGDEARKECLRYGLPLTPGLWTGKPGGAHFWFAWPGQPVRNFARRLPGIDFRGDGGYVLLPPSLHVTGQRYRWQEQTAEAVPAPLPAWLRDLLAGRAPSEGTAPERSAGDALDLSTFLHGIPEGGRDDALWRLASKLRADDVPRPYAEWIVQQAARLCQPPFETMLALDKVARAYVQYAPTPHIDLRAGVLANAVAAVEQAPPETWLQPISTLLSKPELPVNWMVEGLFSVGASGWIGAEPKVGKSWLVLELIYCLTTGTPFLGQFAVPKPRRVIYIQEEDPEQRVLRRLTQLLRGTEGRTAPADNLLRYAIRAGFKLDSAAWAARLRAALVEETADVVVLDVFQRLHLKSENDQAQMAEVLEVLNALSREFGCAFIVVHHNRKPQPGNDARANQMLRGSGVLAGWGECSLFLKKSKTGTGRFTVEAESKDAPEQDEFVVVLEDTPNGGVRLVLAETLVDEHIAGDAVRFLEAALAVVDSGATCTASVLAERMGVNRSTAYRALEMLAESGHLAVGESVFGKFKNRTKIYQRPSRRTVEDDAED